MTNLRKYIELKLELRDLDLSKDEFKIAVLPGDEDSVGDTGAISVPWSLAEWEWQLEDLDRKKLALDDLYSLGKTLAARLLPAGDIRNLYRDAVVKAGQDGGVRLRLIIRSPELAQIPWEFTYDPMRMEAPARTNFLALNPQISIVRYESRPIPPPQLSAANPEHLRLVALTANAKGMRPLKLEVEKRVIEEALENFNVDGVRIDWHPFEEDATADDLTTALFKGAALFHFAGHGLFQPQGTDATTGQAIGEGQIVLVRDKVTKERYLMGARDLADHLQAAGVRLAVLGACHSGRRDQVSPWTGIAPALMERGIAAAVAMQYEVIDDAAVAFSKALYTALAAGLSVDESVSFGRRAMARVPTISPDKNVEWGVPVLYMRSSDGILFPKLAERDSKTAGQLRAEVFQEIEEIKKGSNVIGIDIALTNEQPDTQLKVEQKAKKVSGNLTGARIGSNKRRPANNDEPEN